MFILKVIIQLRSYYLVQMNKDVRKIRKRENRSTVNHSNELIDFMFQLELINLA